MILLLVGLVAFLGIHSLRIGSDELRNDLIAKFGANGFKGMYSIISAIALVLIVFGYSIAREDAALVYVPLEWGRSATLLVMPIALVLLIASNFPRGYIKKSLGHPMLWAIILWCLVHLAANGDSASVTLFGGFLLWAVMDLISCYRRPAGEPTPVKIWPDLASIVAGLGLTVVFVSFLHEWLMGVSIV